MSKRALYTAELAAILGIHPNTIRQYEAWGFLPPVPRSASGYRLFSLIHLGQLRLIRTSLRFTWLGGELRRTVLAMIRAGAAEELGGTLEQAHRLQALVRSERVQAEAAVAYVERWAQGIPVTSDKLLRIGQAARQLNVTHDMLRNWERNGLFRVPRDPTNGYRGYGAAELGRIRVIRTLRLARYSTMSILRMLRRLDEGDRFGLRQALDTPNPDEDVWYATDHWLSTLDELEPYAQDLIAQVEWMLNLPQIDGAGANPIAADYSSRLAQVIDRLIFTVSPDDFWLCGSAAALLQGARLPVRNLNLGFRSPAHVDAAAASLAGWPCLAAPGLNEASVPARYGAVFLLAGVILTLEAPASGLNDPAFESQFVPLASGKHTIRALSLEQCLAAAQTRGRSAQIRPLLKALGRSQGSQS